MSQLTLENIRSGIHTLYREGIGAFFQKLRRWADRTGPLYEVAVRSLLSSLRVAPYRLVPDSFVVDAFNRLYHEKSSQTWQDTEWLGEPLLKYPTDLWVYQQIIFDQRSDYIVEAGTYRGGSAYYLATICEMIDNGHVITVDLDEYETPDHDRITHHIGSSTSSEILDRIDDQIGDEDSCMVILDSDHSHEHVLDELHTYTDRVTEGQYLIVEDTNLDGLPSKYRQTGPHSAVSEFLDSPSGQQFTRDPHKTRYMVTANPEGFLQKQST